MLSSPESRKAIILVRDLEQTKENPDSKGKANGVPDHEQRIRGKKNPGKHVSHQSQRKIQKIDIFFQKGPEKIQESSIQKREG